MTKVVALLVTVVCCWPCASYLHGDVPKATIASQVVDYATRVERMPWTWSDHRASLTESIGRHLFDDEVEILSQDSGYRFAIRLKHAGQVIYAFTGHEETVFARWGDRLYLADFSPRASGCTVLAVNLKTGERLWENRLRGLGPIDHSKYRNRINLTTDGKTITVWGNEAFGRYVELLDKRTGRTVGHKVFPED